MTVSKWGCPGDREISIKRYGEITSVEVKDFTSTTALHMLKREYIFNPDKKYSFVLGKDTVELAEEEKREMATFRNGKDFLELALGVIALDKKNDKTRTILTREIEFAREQNGEFKNIAEMWGALAIELDEVFDHVRDKSYDTPEAHYEMIQAAGILLRWVDEHGDKAEIAKRQEERHGRN